MHAACRQGSHTETSRNNGGQRKLRQQSHDGIASGSAMNRAVAA
jgi:hypothetical protein